MVRVGVEGTSYERIGGRLECKRSYRRELGGGGSRRNAQVHTESGQGGPEYRTPLDRTDQWG